MIRFHATLSADLICDECQAFQGPAQRVESGCSLQQAAKAMRATAAGPYSDYLPSPDGYWVCPPCRKPKETP